MSQLNDAYKDASLVAHMDPTHWCGPNALSACYRIDAKRGSDDVAKANNDANANARAMLKIWDEAKDKRATCMVTPVTCSNVVRMPIDQVIAFIHNDASSTSSHHVHAALVECIIKPPFTRQQIVSALKNVGSCLTTAEISQASHDHWSVFYGHYADAILIDVMNVDAHRYIMMAHSKATADVATVSIEHKAKLRLQIGVLVECAKIMGDVKRESKERIAKDVLRGAAESIVAMMK